MKHMRFVVTPAVGLMLLTLVTGCPTGRDAPPIPADAIFGTEGAGRLSFTAPEDGTVHIFDMSRNDLVFAAQVDQGQEVIVDPQRDIISIDGRRMLEGRLARQNRHSIYLTPDPAARRTMEREREWREPPPPPRR